ncbi:MAG: AsmA family protein, partial [Proteobacteria bacterium]|nr:AsmA family protein [Pseudomonadota bacterium]
AATDIRGQLAFKGRVDAWDAADVSTDLSLTGPDGAELMRQFGLAVPDVDRTGAGSLTLSAMGKSKDGLAVVLRGAMGPTEVTLSGSATLTRDAAPRAELDLDLKSPDVGSLMVLSGNIMQGVIGSTPADVAAHLSFGNRKVVVNRIEGKLGEVPTVGDIAIDFAPAVPRVTGSLSFDEGTLAGLGEAILGPTAFDFPIVESRNPWPEAPFGAALIDGFDTDLALKFGRLDIEGGLAAKGVSLTLASNASGTGLDGIAATLAGGKLSGDLMIKRDLDGTAGVSGTLRLGGAAAEELAWQRDGRPMVTGAFSIDAQVNATGRTLAGWMSSLTGGGSFALEKGRLAHMTTRAFGQVIRLADAGKELSEDRIRKAFIDNVDMGDLAFDRLDAAFTLAGGTLRAPNIVVTSQTGATSGAATMDIARLSLDSEWRLSLDGDGEAAGGVPQVSLLFKGPVADPSRRIDVTAFASYLGIRALEKETERVLMMQADILERELLSRQVLRDRETLDRRNRLMLEARERAAAAALGEKAKAAALLAAEKARADKADGTDPIDAIGRILERGPAEAVKPGVKLKQLPSSDVSLPPGGVTETAP